MFRLYITTPIFRKRTMRTDIIARDMIILITDNQMISVTAA